MQFSKKNIWIASGVIGALVVVIAIFSISDALTPAFSISSSFEDNGNIPAAYTCDGEGISPSISFENVPENTRSLALYIFDQDAPKEGFTHWVVYNIPPQVTDMPQGKVPVDSVEGLNSTQKAGFQPFCPPTGTHRYLFTAYALSNTYTFKNIADIDQLKKVMKWQVLAKATLTGKVTRP